MVTLLTPRFAPRVPKGCSPKLSLTACQKGAVQNCYSQPAKWVRSKTVTHAGPQTTFQMFRLTIILAKLSFQKYGENNLVRNLGRDHTKKCKISCLVGLLNEKQGSSFAHFLYFSKPLTLLTNCALASSSRQSCQFTMSFVLFGHAYSSDISNITGLEGKSAEFTTSLKSNLYK